MLGKILDETIVDIDGLKGWMMISKIPETISRKCDICGRGFAEVQVIDWDMKMAAIHWKCLKGK